MWGVDWNNEWCEVSIINFLQIKFLCELANFWFAFPRKLKILMPGHAHNIKHVENYLNKVRTSQLCSFVVCTHAIRSQNYYDFGYRAALVS